MDYVILGIPRKAAGNACVEGAVEGSPSADEIRAALEHMAASEAFRGSPQLVAFLRYVVEAALRGAPDRIKGYTIAVEALGRAENFDPQSTRSCVSRRCACAARSRAITPMAARTIRS